MTSEVVEEIRWFEENHNRWKAMGHVPQADLERFCGKYVPAMVRNATRPIDKITLVLAYRGRTGIEWVRELLNLDLLTGQVDHDQFELLAGMAAREAANVAACARVQKVFFDLKMRTMKEG